MNVVLAYKNFAANRNISHIGLGVAAVNTAKVLRREGVPTNVWPILGAADLRAKLKAQPADQVIISAPWIPIADLQSLSNEFSETHFAVTCHSNVGFLQADPSGVKLVRDTLDLSMATHNIRLAGNSRRFCHWMEFTFGGRCYYLPNLYYLDGPPPRTQAFSGSGTLRIGVFGAVRPQKNLMSAAGAALEIARKMRVPLELWFSAGRAEGGGEVIMAAIQQMVAGLPGVTLKQNGWQSWPQFRKTVAHMHLLLQPSYTESFNMVTADGAAEGVASVVSEAIDWAPDDWKADVDDVLDISRVGRRLVCDSAAADDGLRALQRQTAEGVHSYKNYFTLR
jgi:glycosyltransferase involved in cell wall biosynthesis